MSEPESKPGAALVPLLPGTVKKTSLPPLAWLGPPHCDADGSIYWHSGYEFNDVTFLKLLADGSHAIYHPADKETGELMFLAFYVTSDGKLLVLAANQKEEVYLLRAGQDPGSFTTSKVDTIEGAGPWTIKSFLAMPNGTLLLQGYFDDKAPKADRGHAYLVEVDSSGHVARRSPEKIEPGAFKTASESAAGSSFIGADGLIYFLEPDKVIAVSQSGEVRRRIPVHPPDAGYEAWQLNAPGVGS